MPGPIGTWYQKFLADIAVTPVGVVAGTINVNTGSPVNKFEVYNTGGGVLRVRSINPGNSTYSILTSTRTSANPLKDDVHFQFVHPGSSLPIDNINNGQVESPTVIPSTFNQGGHLGSGVRYMQHQLVLRRQTLGGNTHDIRVFAPGIGGGGVVEVWTTRASSSYVLARRFSEDITANPGMTGTLPNAATLDIRRIDWGVTIEGLVITIKAVDLDGDWTCTKTINLTSEDSQTGDSGWLDENLPIHYTKVAAWTKEPVVAIVPLVVNAPVVSGIAQTTATLTAAPSGGTTPYNYAWQRDNAGSWVSAGLPNAAAVNPTGLTANTAYSFRVVVTDSGGTAQVVTSAAVTFSTTPAIVITPTQPRPTITSIGYGGTPATGGSVIFSVPVPAGSLGTGITGQVWRVPGHYGNRSSVGAVLVQGGIAAWPATVTESGLQQGKAYWYRAYATGTLGTAESSVVSVAIPNTKTNRRIWQVGNSLTQMTDSSGKRVPTYVAQYLTSWFGGVPVAGSGIGTPGAGTAGLLALSGQIITNINTYQATDVVLFSMAINDPPRLPALGVADELALARLVKAQCVTVENIFIVGPLGVAGLFEGELVLDKERDDFANEYYARLILENSPSEKIFVLPALPYDHETQDLNGVYVILSDDGLHFPTTGDYIDRVGQQLAATMFPFVADLWSGALSTYNVTDLTGTSSPSLSPLVAGSVTLGEVTATTAAVTSTAVATGQGAVTYSWLLQKGTSPIVEWPTPGNVSDGIVGALIPGTDYSHLWRKATDSIGRVILAEVL